jgi:protein-S-isoprenylcysteine O-methyltransferase Ste14
MGSSQLFHHHPIMVGVWVATWALWMIPETILSIRLRSAVDAQKADRGSKIVVLGSVYIGIYLGFIAAYFVPSLFVGTHWKTVFSLGIAVWLGGIFLRLYSIRILGRFFTFDVAIANGHRIVEQGPYRWLRHPSYLGSLLAMIGFGMTMTNWLAMLLPVCCLATAYAYRIPIEEQALMRGLGSDYSNYMRRTWRLIPFVY